MSEAINAALITNVEGVGTSAGDEYALVHCVLNGQDRHALAFSPDMATPIALAFLAAAGHIQKKRAMKSGSSSGDGGVPVDITAAEFAIGKSPGTRDTLVLIAKTKAGAELHLQLSPELAQSIAAAVPKAVATLSRARLAGGSSAN